MTDTVKKTLKRTRRSRQLLMQKVDTSSLSWDRPTSSTSSSWEPRRQTETTPPLVTPAAPTDTVSSSGGPSPIDVLLHNAIINGGAEALLVSGGGASVNSRVNGQSCLHLAAANADLDTVKLLLDRGARVNVANGAGWSPLHYAVLAGDSDVCRALLSRNAWPCSRDNSMFTPLHVLCTRSAGTGSLREIAEQIYESAGAQCLAARDACGRTPYDIATAYGNKNALKVLRELADVSKPPSSAAAKQAANSVTDISIRVPCY